MKWSSGPITQSEAAARQLDAAIRLFFLREDMLAVHTLAAAAYQLLEDLGKPKGIKSRLRNSDRIRPERRKEWEAALRKTQNFLKHADRHAGDVHTYNEKSTVFLLLEAVDLVRHIVPKDSRERNAYRAWFICTFPEVIKPEFAEEFRPMLERAGNYGTSRQLWSQWLAGGK